MKPNQRGRRIFIISFRRGEAPTFRDRRVTGAIRLLEEGLFPTAISEGWFPFSVGGCLPLVHELPKCEHAVFMPSKGGVCRKRIPTGVNQGREALERTLAGPRQPDPERSPEAGLARRVSQWTNSAIRMTMGIGMPSIRSKIERMVSKPPQSI